MKELLDKFKEMGIGHNVLKKVYGELYNLGKSISKEKRELIVKLNKAGFNDREIADLLGISSNTVCKWRHRYRLRKVGYTCGSLYSLYIKRGVFKRMDKMDSRRYIKFRILENCCKLSLETLNKIFER